MIRFRQKGDFSKLTRFLEKAKEVVHLGDLDQFGRAGVAAWRLQRLSTPEKPRARGITRFPIKKVRSPFHSITQTFKMEFQSQSSSSMDMVLEPEAG